MAVGALGTLPAASTADTAHTALAAHTIPVTCCKGQKTGSEPQLVLLTADWQLAKARRPHQCLVPPSGRMYLGCLG